MKDVELFNDSFQNYKSYAIPKAQLIIADVPYQLDTKAYASNPSWYVDGDNKNGESDKAKSQFFYNDNEFRPAEFMHFCSKMLVKEPKGKVERQTAPCMILFCEFEQQFKFIELGKKYGLMHYIPLVFRKNFSAQVLKANMKVVGNCEYGLILYRDKLPKFNNDGKMVFNCFDWTRELGAEKVHPCLPSGEKVFINNEWKNIEDVKIGDRCQYGRIIDTQINEATKLIEIQTKDGVCRATWNHPFLIVRDGEIAWVNAEQIKNTDYLLWQTNVKKYTNQQRKAISDCGKKEKLANSSISLFGKNMLEKFQKAIKFITLMGIKRTITLRTYNLSLPLSTSGYTKVANLSWENGTSHVQYVENINHVLPNTGIIQEEPSMEGFASNVMSKNPWKQENFLLRKVGSVKTIIKKTKVYNLTVEGCPAFDTVVGISHNCQKPVPLLERLIEIFTDPGDVVIDPCAGSGSTLRAAANLGRKAYGFEVNKEFYRGGERKGIVND